MTMRISAGLLSLALLMWVEAASAQQTYSLSVSRHCAVPALSDAEVKRILADPSRMLRKNPRQDADDDVACNVTFTLTGAVGTLMSPNRPVVDSDKIVTVHPLDANVACV